MKMIKQVTRVEGKYELKASTIGKKSNKAT